MEMYSASLSPSGTSSASLSQALADMQLAMIRHWGEVQRDLIRRCTISSVDMRADDGGDNDVERAGAVAAPDDQPYEPEDATPELNQRSTGDTRSPDDMDDGVDPPDRDERGIEASADDEPVAVNAAMAILSNPALAAEAATRSANDAADYEVRDDVADDIAAEIQREAQPEFDAVPKR